MASEPKSLEQAIVYFADYENCRQFLAGLRWPDGKAKCPQCGAERVTYLSNARLWKCYEKHSLQKFSLKTGTVMEDSPIGLDKWLCALWLLVNCRNGVSSCEIARESEHHPKISVVPDASASLCPALWIVRQDDRRS